MWAVALRTLRNPDDAADAVQEAAISAFRHASSFRGDAAVTTWLHRIVVNACLDRLRRRAARPADPLTDGEGTRRSIPPSPTGPSPGRRNSTSGRRLPTLNPDQRAALVLVDMEGYSVEDAAAVLECAVGTVKSRCARGRARLAGLLGHLGPAAATRRPPGGNRIALRCVGLRLRDSVFSAHDGPVDRRPEVIW